MGLLSKKKKGSRRQRKDTPIGSPRAAGLFEKCKQDQRGVGRMGVGFWSRTFALRQRRAGQALGGGMVESPQATKTFLKEDADHLKE